MTAGGYQNEDELLLDAMLALEDIQRRGSELREELSRRIRKAGTPESRPLDREAFKSTAILSRSDPQDREGLAVLAGAEGI